MTDQILTGDALEMLRTLPDESVHCCVTSPPYWGLRDYGVDGQLGLERTPEEYVGKMVNVFREVRRVLRSDGTLWLNLGDSYAGNRRGPEGDFVGLAGSRHNQEASRAAQRAMTASRRRDDEPIPRSDTVVAGLKPKDLVGIPWRVAFALQADGWWLRRDIIWNKPNPMPESVRDRCTTAHEYIFHLAKSGRPTIWRARDTDEWSSAPDHSERLPCPTDDDPDATVARWCGYAYYYDAGAIAESALLSNAASKTVVPTNWAQSGEKTAVAHSRRARGGKTAFRGQGANRARASGPANRDGRDMRMVGAKNLLQEEHDSARRMVANTKRARENGGDHDNPFGATRNRRSVWTVATAPFPDAHFATFPPELVRPCIRAGSPQGGVVLDPFFGAGTTGLVAMQEGCHFIGIELNPAYVEMAERRMAAVGDGSIEPGAPVPIQRLVSKREQQLGLFNDAFVGSGVRR